MLCDSGILQQRWAAQGPGQKSLISPRALGTIHTHEQPFPPAASRPCLPTMTSRPREHFHITTCYVTAWLAAKSQAYNWGNSSAQTPSGQNQL